MIEKLKDLSNKVGVFNILIITYVLVNLLQAIFTPIHEDEAYYWIYSKSLDWGYFDHPPAVALIVKIGTLIFGDTELGIRFATILFSGLAIFFSWKLTSNEIRNKENSFLIFFAVIVSIPGFNMYGFITTPDVPLLFSTVLYLLAYQKLLNKQSVINALFWALTASMLLYSKYHGGVVILVSVIVQPKLLKQWTTYFAGFVALLLITPHLYWQYNHDFISLEYHLFERDPRGFDVENLIGYIGGTLGILNPALFVMISIITFKFRNLISPSGKVYYRMFWGIIVFFFLYSFRSRVEAHWVVVAFIPLALVLQDVIISSGKYKKEIKLISLISIGLLIIVRLAFVFSTDFQKVTLGPGIDYYKSIKEVVPEDRKMVFLNSFQNASKYKFFFNEDAFTYNYVFYRKSQFDLGEFDTIFNNQKVFFSGWRDSVYFDTLRLDNGRLFNYALIDNYTVFTKVKGNIDSLPKVISKDIQEVSITLENPYGYDITFDEGKFPISIKLLIGTTEENTYFSDLKYDLKVLKANSTYTEKMSFIVNDTVPIGAYNCQLVFDYIYPQYVSRKKEVRLED